MVKSETKETTQIGTGSLSDLVLGVMTFGMLRESSPGYETTITDDKGNEYSGSGRTAVEAERNANQEYSKKR